MELNIFLLLDMCPIWLHIIQLFLQIVYLLDIISKLILFPWWQNDALILIRASFFRYKAYLWWNSIHETLALPQLLLLLFDCIEPFKEFLWHFNFRLGLRLINFDRFDLTIQSFKELLSRGNWSRLRLGMMQLWDLLL
jgi:hypothetical protein